MSGTKKKLKKLKFSAEEALNMIISEEYTFGTSSSGDSSQSSYSDNSSDTDSPSPSQKLKKRKKLLPKTVQNDMFYEHGKIPGVSLTHVQPTFTLPIAPEAAKKLDTPPTADHNHDNCQLQNSPDTVQTNTTVEEFVVSIPDTVQTNTTVEELVVSIPIHFQLQNEDTNIEMNNFTFLSAQTFNKIPEQIEFPPEY